MRTLDGRYYKDNKKTSLEKQKIKDKQKLILNKNDLMIKIIVFNPIKIAVIWLKLFWRVFIRNS